LDVLAIRFLFEVQYLQQNNVVWTNQTSSIS